MSDTLKLDPSKDLWTNIAANVKDAAQEIPEFNILILGGRKTGKSGIIQRLCGSAALAVTEPATKLGATALEYFPSRREKQQLHCWELGGGTDLAPLVDVVLSPEQIHTCSVVIVCDLSTPERAFESVLGWLKRVDKRVQDCFVKMRAKGSSTPDKLTSSFTKRQGWDTHPDASTVKPIPLPILVVATKFDLFLSQEKDVARVKLLVRGLRFLAHYHGASFITTSSATLTDDRDAQRLRNIGNHVLLQAPCTVPLLQGDTSVGPVHAVSGADSIKEIHAAPTLTNSSGFVLTGDREVDKWKAVVDESFPPGKGLAEGDKTAAAAEFAETAYKTYAEPVIDAIRRQKDDIQEQSRRAVAKKAAQTAAAQGEGDKTTK